MTQKLGPLSVEHTHRGFAHATFKDASGYACSIQKSSAAEVDCIWLGVDAPNAMQFPGNNTGWHPYELPDNVQCTTRMHLTREQVAALLPMLTKFVETGEIE